MKNAFTHSFLILLCSMLVLPGCQQPDFPAPSTEEKSITVGFDPGWLEFCGEFFEGNEEVFITFVVNSVDLNDPNISNFFWDSDRVESNSLVMKINTIQVPRSGSAQVTVTVDMSCSSCCDDGSTDTDCPFGEAGFPRYYDSYVIPRTENVIGLNGNSLNPIRNSCRNCGTCTDN